MKPCPFCGESKELIRECDDSTLLFWVQCNVCHAHGPISTVHLSKRNIVGREREANENAVSHWNNRLAEDKQKQHCLPVCECKNPINVWMHEYRSNWCLECGRPSKPDPLDKPEEKR